MELNKETVERMCRAAGLAPERRETIRGRDVFVCDGFSAKPEVTFKRFGVTPGEFSFGAYCTIFWIAKGEDFFEVGSPMIFDAFHNPEYDIATKKKARINTALREASGFLATRKKVRDDA